MFVVIPPSIVAAVTQTTGSGKRSGRSQRDRQLRAVGRGRCSVAPRRGNRPARPTTAGQPRRAGSPGRGIGTSRGGASLRATARATGPRTVAAMVTAGALRHARRGGARPAVAAPSSGVLVEAGVGVGTSVGTLPGTFVGTFVGTPRPHPARMSSAHVVNVGGPPAGKFRDIAGTPLDGRGAADADRNRFPGRCRDSFGTAPDPLCGVTTTCCRPSTPTEAVSSSRPGSPAGRRRDGTACLAVAAMANGGWPR
jgi:hypothetical protein